MTNKKKQKARAISSKTGMAHQAAVNVLNESAPKCTQCAHPDHDGIHTCSKFVPNVSTRTSARSIQAVKRLVMGLGKPKLEYKSTETQRISTTSHVDCTSFEEVLEQTDGYIAKGWDASFTDEPRGGRTGKCVMRYAVEGETYIPSGKIPPVSLTEETIFFWHYPYGHMKWQAVFRVNTYKEIPAAYPVPASVELQLHIQSYALEPDPITKRYESTPEVIKIISIADLNELLNRFAEGEDPIFRAEDPVKRMLGFVKYQGDSAQIVEFPLTIMKHVGNQFNIRGFGFQTWRDTVPYLSTLRNAGVSTGK